jgi:hypothetical protein
MPRKFRLSVHRKNEERKKANIPVQNLNVSLPIVHYKLASTPSLSVLQQRTSVMNILPQGWTSSLLTDEQQLLYVMMEQSTDSEPVIVKSLSIKKNFSWQIHVRGKTPKLHSSVVASFPTLLTNISDVERLLQYIDQCRFCCGNPDDKFAALIESKKEFINSSDTIIPCLY